MRISCERAPDRGHHATHKQEPRRADQHQGSGSSSPTGKNIRHPGVWNYIGNQVDQQTDTLLVRATLPNPERLLVDGAFVTVEVRESEEKPRLVIPRRRCNWTRPGVFVLVVDKEHKVEIRRVTTGEAVNTEIAIAFGTCRRAMR